VGRPWVEASTNQSAGPIGKLKALTVAREKRPGMYGDGGGLWLQVTGAGAKSWIFRYTVSPRDPATGELVRDPATGKVRGVAPSGGPSGPIKGNCWIVRTGASI
jgi:hypothetical protein